MSLFEDFDFDSVPELSAVAEGEYEVRILDANTHISKASGKNMVRLVLEIVGQPNADNIYHYIPLPHMDDDERRRNNKLRRIKEFLISFDIAQDEEYGAWVGKTAWAVLGVEFDDQSASDRNFVKRFIMPK